MLRNCAGIMELRSKVNLSRLTGKRFKKYSGTKIILSQVALKIFDPTPIVNAAGPVPFPADIVGVGLRIVDITEREE